MWQKKGGWETDADWFWKNTLKKGACHFWTSPFFNISRQFYGIPPRKLSRLLHIAGNDHVHAFCIHSHRPHRSARMFRPVQSQTANSASMPVPEKRTCPRIPGQAGCSLPSFSSHLHASMHQSNGCRRSCIHGVSRSGLHIAVPFQIPPVRFVHLLCSPNEADWNMGRRLIYFLESAL